MAQVILKDVTKRFGDVVAVDTLNLNIEDKEFVTLVGPSGCGKTTTLRLVAGLEAKTEGEIFFDDEAISHLPANYRDIAMVFQSYALYPHMSVFDNIGFALKMMKVPKSEIERRVKWAADMLSIGILLERKPRELSGGQRQRVALGRAIVREPACFLLDEPLSNLDAKLRVSMRGELKRLHHDIEKTFIYVTHDQAEALTMSDRIAIMNFGELQQFDTPDEVYNRPANMFVAGFIGSPGMNFVQGELVQHNGSLVFQKDRFHFTLTHELARKVEAHYANREITLGVRPETVEVSLNSDEGIDGVVYVEEPLGSDIFLVVEMGEVHVLARADADFRAPIGTKLKLKLNPSKVHFFDPQTQAAIPLS